MFALSYPIGSGRLRSLRNPLYNLSYISADLPFYFGASSDLLASLTRQWAFGKPAKKPADKITQSPCCLMPECPRCHQPVDSRAIACGHCKTPLKAFGHPGIPLYRSASAEFLCNTCIYHEDDTCNYPQRPLAKECTLYHDKAEPLVPQTIPYSSGDGLQSIKNWCQRHLVWLALLGLIIISIALSI